MPPQDLAAEQGVIGSILLDPSLIDDVAVEVKADEFYSHANQKLYGHIVGLHNDGGRIDTTLLVDRLKTASDFGSIGGAAYLHEVINSVAVAAHAVHYAKIVRKHSQRRTIIQATTEMIRAAYDTSREPEDVLGECEATLGAIQTGEYGNRPRTMAEVMYEVMVEIDAVSQSHQGMGCMTGLPTFDDSIGGFYNGELVIVAARPGQGKTSLALQIAAHMADRSKTVYIATLEMSATELALKRLCTEARVSTQKIRSGKIDDADVLSLTEASQVVAVENLFLHDWPRMRVADIERGAKQVQADIVFVDYLQIVEPPDQRKKRYEQVGEISMGLKLMARRLNIPVVACAQIGRQADKDKESRPRLSHLRESGNIENDADMVLLLYRPKGGIKGSGEMTDTRWDAELEVAKNRKGETTTLRIDWQAERTKFSCVGYDDDGNVSGTEWEPM